MESYDLAVAWTWPPDEEFIRFMEEAAVRHHAQLLRIDAANVSRILRRLELNTLQIHRILDRASDENEMFLPLARWVHDHFRAEDPNAPRPLNPQDLMIRAADKATMHLEFISAGLVVPHTVILPPAASEPHARLAPGQMDLLKVPFVVKPANTTGGGNGVVMGVRTVEEVATLRRTNPHDKYLVQETIKPAYLGDFRAWFRVFFVCGSIYPCWWDDQTHAYEEVAPDDERFFGLEILRKATITIAGVCGLDFFSTELALTQDGRLVAVDYVNEMCDMRVQSRIPNGVPEALVRRVAERLVLASMGPTDSQRVSP
jgi:hypothetical protein